VAKSEPNIVSLSSTNGNQLFFVNTSGISSFHCVILNRWGNLINEINDVNGAWDGKDKNGDLVTEGTYFYLIDAIKEGGSAVKMYGFVVLKY
jgi:gliding motility-associated-like protein